MANTYTLIASNTVGSGGASSIDFTSIPSTYTDLCLKVSTRQSSATIDGILYISFNGSTSSFTNKYLEGLGSGSPSSGALARFSGVSTGASATSNTFANNDIYIPNYAGSNNKSFSSDAVTENNATAADAYLLANLWSNTAAINQITLTPLSGTFVQYSTAYLYGIKNS
jgi:hypothetical protein